MAKKNSKYKYQPKFYSSTPANSKNVGFEWTYDTKAFKDFNEAVGKLSILKSKMNSSSGKGPEFISWEAYPVYFNFTSTGSLGFPVGPSRGCPGLPDSLPWDQQHASLYSITCEAPVQEYELLPLPAVLAHIKTLPMPKDTSKIGSIPTWFHVIGGPQNGKMMQAMWPPLSTQHRVQYLDELGLPRIDRYFYFHLEGHVMNTSTSTSPLKIQSSRVVLLYSVTQTSMLSDAVTGVEKVIDHYCVPVDSLAEKFQPETGLEAYEKVGRAFLGTSIMKTFGKEFDGKGLTTLLDNLLKNTPLSKQGEDIQKMAQCLKNLIGMVDP